MAATSITLDLRFFRSPILSKRQPAYPSTRSQTRSQTENIRVVTCARLVVCLHLSTMLQVCDFELLGGPRPHSVDRSWRPTTCALRRNIVFAGYQCTEHFTSSHSPVLLCGTEGVSMGYTSRLKLSPVFKRSDHPETRLYRQFAPVLRLMVAPRS